MSKRKIRDITTIAIIVLVLFGALAAVMAFSGSETETIPSTKFTRGMLDTKGEYVKNDTMLVTEELFECQGLTVEPEFTADTAFEVYYYRSDKTFLGSTGILTGEYNKAETFDNAKYARIVIRPTLEDGKDSIKLWDILGYANDLTVSVLKDQTFDPPVVAAFPSLRDDFTRTPSTYTYHAVRLNEGPYVVAGEHIDAYSGKTVTKIAVPVAGVVNHKEDSVMTVYLVEGDGTTEYKKLAKYELVIPANTFDRSSGVIDKYVNEVYDGANVSWYEFDCEIKVGEGQTLAFCEETDTVYWVYRRGFAEDTCKYPLHNLVFDKSSHSDMKSLELYFDVKYLE